MSTMFSKKKGATTSVFVTTTGSIVATRPTSDDNVVEVKVSMATDSRNPDTITFYFPPTHEVKKGDPLDMAVKSQVIRGNIAIANFGSANNTSDHTLVTEVYFPSAGHKPNEDAKKELAKAYNAARDVHNKAVAAAAAAAAGSGSGAGASGSGSSGSGSGSGGSGSGGSGSGSSGSGSGGSGSSGSGNTPAPIQLQPGCNPAGMKLEFMSQQQAIDDWNRMRAICRQPKQQFVLDDGSIYPATI